MKPFHNTLKADEHEAPGRPVALDRWWTAFDDPIMTRIIERALTQNLELTAALARVQRARAVAEEAGAQRQPAASFAAQAVQLRQSLYSPVGIIASQYPGYARNQSLYDVGAGASWESDLFGQLRRGAEAAQALAEAAEADGIGVRLTVAAEAADAYLEIRGAQARLQIAQDQVTIDQRLLDLVRLRLADGAASGREVAQADALTAQALSVLPTLRIGLEAQMNRLDVLMGAQPGSHSQELDAPRPLDTLRARPVTISADELLRRRPDVIAAERRLAATNAQIGAALAEYYPKVSVSALLGFESLGAAHLLSGTGFQPQAVAGLRWRLFDFGRVDAEVRQARAANAEALAQYRQSVLRAAGDVENAVTAFVQIQNRSGELAHELTALGRARDLSQEDYLEGSSALTDVLDADRELLTARDEYAASQVATAQAVVAIYRASGGGW